MLRFGNPRQSDVTPPRMLPMQTYREEAAARGLAWTTLREEVIRFLWKKRRPCGAYEIARGLGRNGVGRHANSIYRALRPFEQTGLVLSVISRRAFLLVPDPKVRWWGVFLCSGCEAFAVAPMREAGQRLRGLIARGAFIGRSFSIECLARCRCCTG